MVAILAVLGVSAGVTMGRGVTGLSTPALAQTPAATPEPPRTMSFSWTLYP